MPELEKIPPDQLIAALDAAIEPLFAIAERVLAANLKKPPKSVKPKPRQAYAGV